MFLLLIFISQIIRPSVSRSSFRKIYIKNLVLRASYYEPHILNFITTSIVLWNSHFMFSIMDEFHMVNIELWYRYNKISIINIGIVHIPMVSIITFQLWDTYLEDYTSSCCEIAIQWVACFRKTARSPRHRD